MLLRRHGALMVFFAVVCLCSFGLVMLYSASAFTRQAEEAGDTLHFLRTQSVWLGLGLVICVVVSFVDYRVWWRFIAVLGVVSVALLVLCYVPGIQHRVNHEVRWIKVGPWVGQPSELAKVVLVLFLAGWYGWVGQRRQTLVWGLLLPGAAAALVVGLVLFERDIGTALLLAGVTGGMMFVAGVPARLLAVGVVCAGLGISLVVQMYPDKAKRILDWLNPRSEAAREARWQQDQALIALGSGGIEGVGFGDSRQKMRFLPEAHTDCIFAVIGEELGLRATLMVVGCFVVVVVAGGFIASRAPDLNGILVGMGSVLLLGLQAIINVGVVTAVLPNKGISLPFISAGGSGLLASLVLVGLLMSIATRVQEVEPEDSGSAGRRGRGPRKSWLGESPSSALPPWIENGDAAQWGGGS